METRTNPLRRDLAVFLPPQIHHHRVLTSGNPAENIAAAQFAFQHPAQIFQLIVFRLRAFNAPQFHHHQIEAVP